MIQLSKGVPFDKTQSTNPHSNTLHLRCRICGRFQKNIAK